MAVGLAQHVELVIEVDDRVSGALTARSQEGRYEHYRPQHRQDDQDRQRQDLSSRLCLSSKVTIARRAIWWTVEYRPSVRSPTVCGIAATKPICNGRFRTRRILWLMRP